LDDRDPLIVKISLPVLVIVRRHHEAGVHRACGPMRWQGVSLARLVGLEEQEGAFPRPEKQAAARLAAHQAKAEHVRIEALRLLLVGKVEHGLEHAGQLRGACVTGTQQSPRDLFLALGFARHVPLLTTTTYTHPRDQKMWGERGEVLSSAQRLLVDDDLDVVEVESHRARVRSGDMELEDSGRAGWSEGTASGKLRPA